MKITSKKIINKKILKVRSRVRYFFKINDMDYISYISYFIFKLIPKKDITSAIVRLLRSRVISIIIFKTIEIYFKGTFFRLNFYHH